MAYRVLGLIGATAMIVASASTANAASSSVSSYPLFYGYLDLHGGYDTWSERGTYCAPGAIPYKYEAHGSVFGGSGHVAVALSPDFSFQADAWGNSWQGTATYTEPAYYDRYHYDNVFPGIAGHLTWREKGGIFASYGRDPNWGDFATVGLEAFHDFGKWRYYGQVGYTGAVNGYASNFNAKDWYGQGVVSYYFDPGLALSANFGADHYSDDTWGGLSGTGLNWGTRVEYKFASMPVSTYVAYQGWHWSTSDHYPDSWHGTEHTFIVGLRVLFGGKTLREIDQHVGLTDMNAIYGENFPH